MSGLAKDNFAYAVGKPCCTVNEDRRAEHERRLERCGAGCDGGGLGLPNGGQLPNGWRYRFSITRTLANDGRNYENGVPPDTVVRLIPGQTTQDNVIEQACQRLVSNIAAK